MKKLIIFILLIFPINVIANINDIKLVEADYQEVSLVKYVKDLASYAKRKGKYKAVVEFKRNRFFKNKKMHLFSFDYKGKVLAHRAKPKITGKNIWNLRDKKGKYLTRELSKLSKGGGGFAEFYWPYSRKIRLARAYVEPAGTTYFVGAMVFIDD